jgi:hypothetical protein
MMTFEILQLHLRADMGDLDGMKRVWRGVGQIVGG